MDKDTRGAVRVEQGAKRVRAYLAGRLVADTRRPLLVWEIPYYPAYYLPLGGRAAELGPPARPSTRRAGARRSSSTSGWTGAAAEAAAGATRTPRWKSLRDLVRFDWAAMDEWLEEDEPVYTHPRDPYTRVDILASSRHVQVEVDGVTVADCTGRASCSRRAFRRATTCRCPTSATDLLRPRTPSATARTRARPATGRSTPGTGPPRPGLDLPRPAAGEPEGRRAGLLLQREGRPLPRRRAPGAPPHPLQLTGGRGRRGAASVLTCPRGS